MTYFPAPAPIRTTPDNAFAHATMTDRLPANIRNVINAHPEYSRTIRGDLEDLADAITRDRPIPAPALPAWDYEQWQAEYGPYAGDTWHDTDWFFGETYGFRLVLQACRYFETRIDPYGPMKRAELESGAPFLPFTRFFGSGGPAESILDRAERAAEQTDERDEEQRAEQTGELPGRRASTAGVPPEDVLILEEALHLAMWGNKADISFTAGETLDHSEGDRELLLLDHGARAAEHLVTRSGPAHIVMDNSGAELAGDLVLALTVIAITGKAVVLHPKMYPTYVSDTTVEDIREFLRIAELHGDAEVRRGAIVLRTAFERGQLSVAPDQYWCGTRYLPGAPERITRLLADAAILVVKGDFNYRRVFRDTIWSAATDAEHALGCRYPFPIVLLRTMKSDCLVGCDNTVVNTLDRTEPGWRTAGKRGVIQLVKGVK